MAHEATRLRGTGVSSGAASGPLYLAPDVAAPRVAAGDLAAAAARTAERLHHLAATAAPEARAILEAQALMAVDPALLGRAGVLAGSMTASEAIIAAADEYARRIEALPDAYLQARAADARDAGGMVARELGGGFRSRLSGLERPSIVVAEELAPVDTLSVDPHLLLGIVTERGGPTAHAAIVARELGIPAVVGVKGAVAAARGQGWGEVDATAGEFRTLSRRPGQVKRQRRARFDLSNSWVRLMANVSSAAAAAAAADTGARGVGLFRTEMLFLGRDRPMAEEEQAAAYATACAAMRPEPVVVRCLDVGSDKAVPYLGLAKEPNPALGRRGVRLWLEREELWRPQAAALARVAREHPNLEVMFPMVGAPEELAEARERIRCAAAGGRVPRIGMMVELPAAVAGLRAFKGLADFISIGTNDLTQYALGIDRELGWPSYLDEFSPGVLRLIETAITTARELGIESAVCGELAGSPEGAVFLAGVGVDSLSMAVDAIGPVHQRLLACGQAACAAAAQAALAATTAAGAKRALARV